MTGYNHDQQVSKSNIAIAYGVLILSIACLIAVFMWDAVRPQALGDRIWMALGPAIMAVLISIALVKHKRSGKE